MPFLRLLRKTVFWLHLGGGLTAGLVILLLAVTGTLLTYERQILSRFDGHPLTAPSTPELSLEELAAKVLADHQGPALSGIAREAGEAQPYVFQFGREKQLFINPFTGEVLGEGAPRLRGFFSFITGLHRWLALQGDQREVGKAITGIAALFFCFLLLSGLWLWWPRRWTWMHLKRIVTFQPRLHGPARNWNWHNVIGFWLCLPLLVITLTGIVMSFEWANFLVYRLQEHPCRPPRVPAPLAAKAHLLFLLHLPD